MGVWRGGEEWACESIGLGTVLGRDRGAGLAVVQDTDLDLDEAGDKALNLALAQVADKAVGKAPSKVLSIVLKKPAEMCLAERSSIRPGGRRRGEWRMTKSE